MPCPIPNAPAHTTHAKPRAAWLLMGLLAFGAVLALSGAVQAQENRRPNGALDLRLTHGYEPAAETLNCSTFIRLLVLGTEGGPPVWRILVNE